MPKNKQDTERGLLDDLPENPKSMAQLLQDYPQEMDGIQPLVSLEEESRQLSSEGQEAQ